MRSPGPSRCQVVVVVLLPLAVVVLRSCSQKSIVEAGRTLDPPLVPLRAATLSRRILGHQRGEVVVNIGEHICHGNSKSSWMA